MLTPLGGSHHRLLGVYPPLCREAPEEGPLHVFGEKRREWCPPERCNLPSQEPGGVPVHLFNDPPPFHFAGEDASRFRVVEETAVKVFLLPEPPGEHGDQPADQDHDARPDQGLDEERAPNPADEQHEEEIPSSNPCRDCDTLSWETVGPDDHRDVEEVGDDDGDTDEEADKVEEEGSCRGGNEGRVPGAVLAIKDMRRPQVRSPLVAVS